MNDGSFASILKEKMENSSSSYTESPSHKNSVSYNTTSEEWLFKISLNISDFFSSGKKNYKSQYIKNYQNSSIDNEKVNNEVPTDSLDKQTTTANQKTTIKPIEWSFEQQLTIQKFISYGADLKLESSEKEIKSAYKKLIRTFHPDANIGCTPTTGKALAKALQDIVESFNSSFCI